MSDIKHEISKAKAKLLVEYPLFGAIASKLELVQNDDIESFKSNGIKLEYNGDYLRTLDSDEMEFVFANGAMHASLAYENRKSGRSSWLWQLSTDYAINDMLVQNGMKLPFRAHYQERFSGMYAEEIYAHLKDEILRDELEYESDSNDDAEQNSDPGQHQEHRIDEAVQEELFGEFAKAKVLDELNRGEPLAAIERFFDISCEGKIDWRNELRSAIERFHRDSYTLIPPSKKLLYKDIYLPSTKSERFKLAVAIDSSGSIGDAMLSEFLGELGFLMLSVQNYEIELMVCDDKIRSRRTFYAGDVLEAEIKGGGGTDFRPVFKALEEEAGDVKLLLYFTDMDGVFPSQAPYYEVKWVSAAKSTPPFGEVIPF